VGTGPRLELDAQVLLPAQETFHDALERVIAIDAE
jgi:hypothetical protein